MHEVKQIDLKDTLDGEFLKSLSMNPADYRIMRHREIGHPHTAKQSFKIHSYITLWKFYEYYKKEVPKYIVKWNCQLIWINS